MARENITLKCTVCGEENYITTKNKKKQPERIEKKKYCIIKKVLALVIVIYI